MVWIRDNFVESLTEQALEMAQKTAQEIDCWVHSAGLVAKARTGTRTQHTLWQGSKDSLIDSIKSSETCLGYTMPINAASSIGMLVRLTTMISLLLNKRSSARQTLALPTTSRNRTVTTGEES
jgi:hypothetical protein